MDIESAKEESISNLMRDMQGNYSRYLNMGGRPRGGTGVGTQGPPEWRPDRDGWGGFRVYNYGNRRPLFPLKSVYLSHMPVPMTAW